MEKKKKMLAQLESRNEFSDILANAEIQGMGRWRGYGKENLLWTGAAVTRAQNTPLQYMAGTGKISSVQVV